MSTTTTATATKVPAAYRKAARIANETALTAGELVNSLNDGLGATPEEVRGLCRYLATANNKRKSLVDASTATMFYDAVAAFSKAEFALLADDTDAAANYLDEGATQLERVEGHVQGLFTR